MPSGFDTFMYWAVFIITYFWWAGILIFLFIWRSRLRKYPIEAVIVEQRGETLRKTNDRLGKFFIDGINKYMFKATKDTIPITEYSWIYENAVMPTNFLERIINFMQGTVGCSFMFKYGSKQYKPLSMTLDKEEIGKQEYIEIKDKRGSPIYVKQYIPLRPEAQILPVNFEVIDWDNMNFMVQEHRATLDRRQRMKNNLEKLIPVILFAVAGMVFILAMYFSKEMLMSAGKAVPNKEPAKAPNIPIISDILPAS